jgi:hypothetical protein
MDSKSLIETGTLAGVAHAQGIWEQAVDAAKATGLHGAAATTHALAELGGGGVDSGGAGMDGGVAAISVAAAEPAATVVAAAMEPAATVIGQRFSQLFACLEDVSNLMWPLGVLFR